MYAYNVMMLTKLIYCIIPHKVVKLLLQRLVSLNRIDVQYFHERRGAFSKRERMMTMMAQSLTFLPQTKRKGKVPPNCHQSHSGE